MLHVEVRWLWKPVWWKYNLAHRALAQLSNEGIDQCCQKKNRREYSAKLHRFCGYKCIAWKLITSQISPYTIRNRFICISLNVHNTEQFLKPEIWIFMRFIVYGMYQFYKVMCFLENEWSLIWATGHTSQNLICQKTSV